MTRRSVSSSRSPSEEPAHVTEEQGHRLALLGRAPRRAALRSTAEAEPSGLSSHAAQIGTGAQQDAATRATALGRPCRSRPCTRSSPRGRWHASSPTRCSGRRRGAVVALRLEARRAASWSRPASTRRPASSRAPPGAARRARRPSSSTSPLALPPTTERRQGALERSRRVRRRPRGERPAPAERASAGEAEPDELTSDQAAAVASVVAALDGGGHVLLAGPTGAARRRCISRRRQQRSGGRGVIVLVPEIALAPQTVGRFRALRRHGRDRALAAGRRRAARRAIGSRAGRHVWWSVPGRRCSRRCATSA